MESVLQCDAGTTRSEPGLAATHAEAGAAARSAGNKLRCAIEFAAAMEADPRNTAGQEWSAALLSCWLQAAPEPQASHHAESSAALSAAKAVVDLALRQRACLALGTADEPVALHRLGMIRYRSERYSDSFALFDAAARKGLDSDVAAYAVALALDSLIAQGNVCEPAFRHRLGTYRAELCEARRAGRWRDQCQLLQQQHCSLLVRDAERLFVPGEHATASVAFERIARDPECGAEGTATLLYNAAKGAELAGEIARAQQLFAELRARFPDSSLANAPKEMPSSP